MKNRLCMLLTAGVLSCTLLLSGCGSSSSGDAGTASEASDAEDVAGTDEEDADEEDLDEEVTDIGDADDEESDDEDLEFFDGDDYEAAPYDEVLEEYLDLNSASALIKSHDNLLFSETLKGSTGIEIYAYNLFVGKNQKLIRYSDGYQEFTNGEQIDGFDPTDDAPFRYVFNDTESKADQEASFDEFLYVWPGEGAEEQEDDGKEILLKCYIRDASMVEMVLYEEESEVEEGDYIERDLYFDSSSKEFLRGKATYYKAGGEPVQIGECTLLFDTEEQTPDRELLDKLSSSDSHSLTLTLDPGTDEETVLESTVGKGCTFYPIIYDGYTFYTDKELKTEAPEDLWSEKEKDLVIYAVFAEDEDLDGDELEISEDELLDLEGLEPEDDDAETLTEEELQELLENGTVG